MGQAVPSGGTVRASGGEDEATPAHRYQLLFDTMHQGVVFQDAEGTILSMNPAAERILGKTSTEFLQQTSVSVARDTIREDGSPFPGPEHPSMVALRTGREQRDVVMGVFNPREKGHRWISISAVPLFRRDEARPYQVYTHFEDITERKRDRDSRRETEERYRGMFESHVAAFALHEIILDESGAPCDYRFLEVNPAFERLTGLVASDIIGRTVSEVLPGIEQVWIEHFGRVAQTGVSDHFSSYSQALQRHYDVTAYPAGPGRFAVMFVDITARTQAEQALRSSTLRLRRFYESGMLGVLYWNTDGIITDANDKFLEMIGYSREELGRIDWVSMTPPEYQLLDEQSIAELKAIGINRTPFEKVYLRKDGTRIPIIIAGAMLDEARHDGVAFVLDITDRKRAEEALRESEERFRALADSIPQLAWTAQADGYITWYNQRWYSYTGTTPQQMKGWGWQSLHDPLALPDVLRRWKESIANGTTFDMEFPLRGADGKFRRFLTRVLPLKDHDGKVLQWFGTNTDVTELVEAQESLKESARRKDEFLGMLSHELRNPLAPIRNSVYILERADPTGEQAARARAVIQRQTEHLTRLVDDLLDVTRIARGKIELRRSRVDLREVVWSAADDFRLMMHDRGITYRTALPDTKLWADADATRITQSIGNLLHNAAKFTPRGGEVTLSVRAVEGAVEVSVRDTGTGIDSALLPHVFDAFVQGERTLARTEGGLGLGLALVKGITELHGGAVRAESAGKDQGAEIIVHLPLIGDPVAQDAPHPGDGRTSGGRRVLVVDDHADAAESLAEIMRMLGHVVAIAYDGPSAIEKGRTTPLDIVLCDLGLPGMSGYEVAKALRADGKSGMLLIAVSGYAQPDDVKKAVEAGFDAHVAKPCDPQEIVRLLR